MATLFCCDSIKPYKAQRTDHETKFLDFMAWTKRVVKDSDISSESATSDKVPSYTIQLVRQVNYGPLESRRYFARFDEITDGFVEVSENFLIQANFQKVNSFKNFKCNQHNRFFELNLYQKNPVNKHHWRANLARPASSIDVSSRLVDSCCEQVLQVLVRKVVQGNQNVKCEERPRQLG